jgi:hypothetical protein
MRKPGLAFLLLLFAASHSVAISAPLNLFRPETGQRTAFEVWHDSGRKVHDTVSYWIESQSGDSAKYGVLYSKSRTTGFLTFSWAAGRLTAPNLLKSRRLDTNGIFRRRKTFPADYTRRSATNTAPSGITLQHTVSGFLFDTLLVSCSYEAELDAGDNCDFLTPSGILVYSSVEMCLCAPPSFRIIPDAATLAAMGGKPVSIRVAGKPLRNPAAAWVPMEGFDVRGRRAGTARAHGSIAAPAR